MYNESCYIHQAFNIRSEIIPEDEKLRCIVQMWKKKNDTWDMKEVLVKL